MEVQWREVSVKVKGREILAPLSGELRKGRMMALMGPSGSGKSTLLNCLRQVITHQGEVRYDGARFCPDLRQCIGFTEQDDVVLPQLTVRQSLRFLGDLRFGLGSEKSKSRVDEVMKALHLTRIADSVIGEAASGGGARISGGERRRLCIARELLGEPRLLICDEPTSGLDSTMAAQVVRSMRELCDSGDVTVLSAIHQPSTSIFERFDDLVLLCEGQVLYQGSAAEVESVFASYGLSRRSAAQSVAEFVMDLLVINTSPSSECSELGEAETAVALLPPEARKNLVAHAKKLGDALPALPALSTAKPAAGAIEKRYDAPFLRQVAAIIARQGLLLKGETFNKNSCALNLSLMLIPALLWFRLGFEEADIFPRWGLSLWILGTWMFFPLMGSLGTFAACRRMLEKELSVGCYSLVAFYIARTVALFPLEFFWPSIWVTGVYWISNMNPSFVVFLEAFLVVCLSFAVFQGVGLALGASSLGPSHAVTLSQILITYFFAWTGFFVDLNSLPSWLSWLHHANPFKYATHLMLQIVLPEDIEFDCASQFEAGTGVRESAVGCSLRSDGKWRINGEEARLRQKVDTDPWLCLGFLLGTLVLTRILAFVLLRRDLWAAVHGAQRKAPSSSSPSAPAAPTAEATAAAAPKAAAEAPKEDDGREAAV